MSRSIIAEGPPPGNEPMGSINVTSLVDVMFCLLIMFMVATPLISPEGEEVELPAGRGEKIAEEEFNYGVISIDSAGKVFLGALPLSDDPEKMKTQLAENAKIQEDGMVFIQGDQNVQYSKIVDVLVALKDADIPSVGFVTDPNEKRLREPVK